MDESQEAKGAEKRSADAPLEPEAKKARVEGVEWKDGHPSFPDSSTMATYFLDDRIDKDNQGHRSALIHSSGTWTFSEARTQAHKAANVLHKHGLEIENRVLLLQNNNPELVFAYFGAQYLGAVCTMAVPHLDKDELYLHFLQYTRAKVVVAPHSILSTIERLRPQLHHLKAVLITHLDSSAPQLQAPYFSWQEEMSKAASTLDHRPPDLCSDDVALWYFTGGTTGMPKGCVHLQSDMPYAAETYGKLVMELKEDDITATVSPMVGPYAMGSNLLFPWSVGAAAVLDDSQPATAKSVFELIQKFKPSVLSSTPGIIRGMIEEHKKGHKADISCLRYITSAGDVLPAATHKAWVEAFNVPVLDGIGTSELQHIFISNTLAPDGCKVGSVGKPVPGYSCSVVDNEGHEVETGEVGELKVVADSNSVCYFNKHQKSKETFIGDQYLTGDLAYRDAEGFFYLCGRKTDLISMFSAKKRDLKASFLRVEDQLLQHPQVKDCAVVEVGDASDSVYTAYCVVTKEAEDHKDTVKEELLGYLSTFFSQESLPTSVVLLPRIPRNARDKIERKLMRQVLASQFIQADTDGSGSIDFDELQILVSNIMPDQGSPECVRKLFKEYDVDGNGKIDFDEFQTFMMELACRTSKK